EKELTAARSENYVSTLDSSFEGLWAPYIGGHESQAGEVDTGVPVDRLKTLLDVQTRRPEGFNVHPKIKRLLRLHREMVEGKRPLDWAAAESLALASLAT